jgi:hypothetical protein
MRYLLPHVPLALAATAILAVPAVAPAEPPVARAAGSDAVELVYPSIVRARIERTERALRRATKQLETGRSEKAVTSLKVVRRQMAAAWRGARYVIRTAPPPVADEARISGDGPTGPTYAGSADTAFAVLTLQHEVAATVVELVDGGGGTALTALSRTLYLALDRRDRAIRDIRALAPPADPEAEDARARARTSGDGPVVATFDTMMPNVLGQLDDELQAIEGTLTDAEDLTPGGRRVLSKAEPQVRHTKQVVNSWWPPVPAED